MSGEKAQCLDPSLKNRIPVTNTNGVPRGFSFISTRWLGGGEIMKPELSTTKLSNTALAAFVKRRRKDLCPSQSFGYAKTTYATSKFQPQQNTFLSKEKNDSENPIFFCIIEHRLWGSCFVRAVGCLTLNASGERVELKKGGVLG